MVPIGVVSSGKSVLAIGGPRIISLVLLVLSCMSSRQVGFSKRFSYSNSGHVVSNDLKDDEDIQR